MLKCVFADGHTRSGVEQYEVLDVAVSLIQEPTHSGV